MSDELDSSSGPGGRLRQLRRRAGLDQATLARLAGVSVRTLRDIERGRVARPRDTSVHNVLAALPLTDAERTSLRDGFAVSSRGTPLRSRPRPYVGVLGPLLVSRSGEVLALDQTMPRTLLALLALSPGQPVSVDAAIDVLWGDDPPRTCRNLVQVYIGRIRRLLRSTGTRVAEAEPVRFSGSGYQLDPTVVQVDVADFDALHQAARTAIQPETAAARYLEALRCWRGPVLDDADPRLRHHPRSVHLNRRRIEAATAYADLALAAGRAGEALTPLRELATIETLDEGLHARLIRALAAAGEHAGAVTTFLQLRRRLFDELGVSPGPTVLAAYRDALTADHGSDTEPPVYLPIPVLGLPAQLPAGTHAFVGRESALRHLDELLDPAGAGVPLVVVVTGPGGVGKTALTVQWGHSAADRFPDGQLYVDLHGFDGSDDAVDPDDAIRGFLDALGVEPSRVPPGRAAQAALYRSLSSGRRLLVVLDNARDAEQVRPLLAAGPAVCTIITSRVRLTSLVAESGAHTMVLTVPDRAEAADLLRRRIGNAPYDVPAVEEVVTACGRLPLALALVAARVRQSGFPLAACAAELRQPGLAPLSGLRSVFSWSYRPLSPSAARMFRLLGSTVGTDTSTPAAAALAGMEIASARQTLGELIDANLVTEHAPGRYQLHDLLRAYARELAHEIDTPDDRKAALRRLLDYYTHTAYQAERTLNPTRAPIRMPVIGQAHPTVPHQRLDARAAREWLGTERTVLLSALRQARTEGLDRQAWQLGWAMDTFLAEHRHWKDEGAAWAVALSAATALMDQPAAAHAHLFLAVAASRLDRFNDAHAHVRRALDLSRVAGDRPGEAENHFVLSYVCWLQGNHDGALHHAQQSLSLWAGLDQPAWEGKAGNGVGLYLLGQGTPEKALPYFERSLKLFRHAGDVANEVVVRVNLGQAHHDLGYFETATDHYRRGLSLARAQADSIMAAQITAHLGDTYQAIGDDAAARDHWQDALRVLADAGHPQAADIRRRLDSIV